MDLAKLWGQKVKLMAILGVVLGTLFNLLALERPTAEDVENADMSVLAGKVIVIDPGHGGIDGGAEYNGLVEKNVTLALALAVGEELKAKGVEVLYTREVDTDYYTKGKGGKRSDLLKRVELINQSGAQLFLSIHTNAIADARWSGAEAYYNPKVAESRRLAETIQVVFQAFPEGNTRQSKQDLDILVLKNTIIPGVLIEAGFLSNPKESTMLVDSNYQKKMAQQIAKAVAYHFCNNVVR